MRQCGKPSAQAGSVDSRMRPSHLIHAPTPCSTPTNPPPRPPTSPHRLALLTLGALCTYGGGGRAIWAKGIQRVQWEQGLPAPAIGPADWQRFVGAAGHSTVTGSSTAHTDRLSRCRSLIRARSPVTVGHRPAGTPAHRPVELSSRADCGESLGHPRRARRRLRLSDGHPSKSSCECGFLCMA